MLVAPKYGYVKVSGNVLDSVATYSCLPHHKLIGDATRKCYYDKTWTGETPICMGKYSNQYINAILTDLFIVIKCPGLSHPEYGHVKINDTLIGGSAYYSCNRGYYLVGYAYRKCLKTGGWDGKVPVCKREWLYNTFYVCLSHLYLFAVIKCAVPVAPKYGFVTVSHYRLDGVARYTCKPGYKLVGVATRKCYYDKSWTGVAPICKRK